jgi:thiol-disulfide isomerase/thioredoxin/protocatechuate 3,4-dioxygenase beta subunit
VGALSVFVASVSLSALAQSPYRMQGTVTDAETGRGISGSTIQVLIESESDLSMRLRQGQSDSSGRYAVDLPVGHAMAWMLLPPNGFVAVEQNAVEGIATTEAAPIVTKNYQVRKGVPVRVKIRTPGDMAIPANTWVSLSKKAGNTYVYAAGTVEGDGNCVVTLPPPLDGRYDVRYVDDKSLLRTSEAMSVDFQEGFDPTNVATVIEQTDDGRKVVHDVGGRLATLQGCEGLTDGRQLSLALDAKPAAPTDPPISARGIVVDARGKPIEGATITVAFHSDSGGSASSQIRAETDDDGHFSIDVPTLRADRSKISLIVTSDGHAGMDTEPTKVTLAPESRIWNVGTISLADESFVRIRVVDPDGSPLHGAIVEPLNDYASRTRITRTDANGECDLTGLAHGLMRISARFATLTLSTKLPLDVGDNEAATLKVVPVPSAASSPDRPPPLTAGTPAPQWVISEWSDGKTRQISDYRGKVVVLDFWGVWCGPCISAIPAMKELSNRYEDDGVVFLSVHTAGTDMSLVKRLLSQQQWAMIVGLDAGDDIVSGKTVQAYAVQGFPTLIVVDPAGRIAFNSGDTSNLEAMMREAGELAQSAGIPWPLDTETDVDLAKQQMSQIMVMMYSRKIEQALKAAP